MYFIDKAAKFAPIYYVTGNNEAWSGKYSEIRIPLVGGIFAPNQGFFPKYTSGSYSSNNTTMFVSRGLGNSLFPIRIFNRPEIIAVTLKVSK